MEEKKRPTCPFHPKVELLWMERIISGVGWGVGSNIERMLRCPVKGCLMDRNNGKIVEKGGDF